MKTKPIIETITLNIGGKQIQVTKEEAEKLHAALGELFAPKQITIPMPYPIYRAREIDRRPHWWDETKITCHSNPNAGLERLARLSC